MKNAVSIFLATTVLSVSSFAMTIECIISTKEYGSEVQKLNTTNPNFYADLINVDDAYYSVITQQTETEAGEEAILVKVTRQVDGSRSYEQGEGSASMRDDEYNVNISCKVKKSK